MNSPSHRFWLHFDLNTNTAHLLDLRNPAVDPPGVTGLVFANVGWPEDFVADAMDLSHGDASAVLMGVEMRGNTVLWAEIEPEYYASLEQRGEVASIRGQTFAGARVDEQGRTWTVIAGFAPLELTSHLP